MNPYSTRDEIQNLDNMLSDFALGLPAHLREETKNLLSRAYSSGLTGYINLHTLWHQCYCDLYRLMIPGIRESVTEEVQQQVPVEYANECRRRCLSHAMGICKLWSETLREGDLSRISDQSIGIYAYQCANVLVNLWDLDHDNALKSSLQTIASFLNRLVLIYPIVAEIQTEIKQLISSLDVVTDFYRTHTSEFLNQSLNSAWRSSLRQQGIQGGQTTSKFSLLEFLQNQNRSEESASTEYTPGTADPEPCIQTQIDHIEALNMGVLAPNADTSDMSAEFWSSTPLDMDFGSYETRVDPFYRIFDDWALTALS
ncbi:uncharacterized protein N7483_001783 [Penicillium malachiteum]|uniref:uncharacterized protein n=1 Tax=Penicillium malachiteum TaxID=1324776 RepID=UPI0025466C3D|nr:uncharacterized protein N7483_001783 [Penicillium malachiteum]KAJ5736658.1 hypothetical protein N7483_001783 [Penicillium malachiteum]